MTDIKATTGVAHYKTSVLAGDHQIWADEPVENGGTAAGPSPTQLLAASLACCTSITLRMYADRKGIPVENIEVNVKLVKDTTTGDTFFERQISLSGASLTDEQRHRFVQIAGGCPVSKLLANQTKINTTLV